MAKTLIIVESPHKAQVISKFLGGEYIVKSSVGHVRELPDPKSMTKTEKDIYGSYAIDVDDDFKPLYKVSRDKSKVVKELREAVGKVSEVVLATDSDVEGESIAWHLNDLLSQDFKKHGVIVSRATWNEITKKAVTEGLKNKREIDNNRADSGLARSLYDRLFGFTLSPVLWRTIAPGTSGGRVQSPALRLVVEREKKRLAFKSINYYTIKGVFNGEYESTLTMYGGVKVASSAQIDDEGNVKDNYLLITDDNLKKVMEDIGKASYKVDEVSSKPYKRTPPPPFTTSSALKSIGGKSSMSTKMITSVLQNLYQNGFITYIRTISIEAAPDSIFAARKAVKGKYGEALLPDKPRFWKDKNSGNSGHECIRPVLDEATGFLSSYRGGDRNEQLVFNAVNNRFLASQSVDCTGVTWSAKFVNDDATIVFGSSETIIDVRGWTEIYDDAPTVPSYGG